MSQYANPQQHDKNINSSKAHPLLQPFLNEFYILIIILLNTGIIILDAMPAVGAVTFRVLHWIDYGCSIFFVIEAIVKIKFFGLRGYWNSWWNRIDFLVVVVTLPFLFEPVLELGEEMLANIALLRMGRFFQFLRFLRVLRFIRLARATKGFSETVQPAIIIVIILFGIRLGIPTLDIPTSVAQISERWIYFLMTLAGTWFVTGIYSIVHDTYIIPWAKQSKARIDDLLVPILKTAINFLLWISGLTASLSTLGYDPAALLTSLGIGGLAFALAAQDTISNIFGGITVFLHKPFKIGDRIKVADVDGYVQHIGLRASLLKDFEGRSIVMPNRSFTNYPITNIDSRASYLIHSPLYLHYGTSSGQVQLALKLLKQIVEANELVEDSCWVNFDKIDRDSLNIELWYRIKKRSVVDKEIFENAYDKIYLVKTQINLRIMEAFEQNQIQLALPTSAKVEAKVSIPPQNSLYYLGDETEKV